MRSIYWHDYETWGSDTRRDKPCQFAGIRTDEDLQLISDPLVLYCRPPQDYLPDPEACLVTGISPQEAASKGLAEAEFCHRIAEEFSLPQTCVVGYNSLRFDDEITRNMFYRCFLDPYEREWKNGNSRWDLIDLVRMTHALRPEGIAWPRRDDGSPSFRLEELTRANDIAHEAAHDALSDVMATISMARLIKDKQPRLYDYYFQLRQKSRVLQLLDLRDKPLLVHVSGMFPAKQGCMSVVMPLMVDPQNSNGVIVCDLQKKPDDLFKLDASSIQQRLFTPGEELARQELERPGLKTVHINRCPALAPISVLSPAVLERYGIDLEACEARRQEVLAAAGLEEKLTQVFSRNQQETHDTDPELMLYSGGFLGNEDKALMQQIRHSDPCLMGQFESALQDQRLPTLLFRYRARNFPESLNQLETASWKQHCVDILTSEVGGIPYCKAVLDKTRNLQDSVTADKQDILMKVEKYILEHCRQLGISV